MIQMVKHTNTKQTQNKHKTNTKQTNINIDCYIQSNETTVGTNFVNSLVSKYGSGVVRYYSMDNEPGKIIFM